MPACSMRIRHKPWSLPALPPPGRNYGAAQALLRLGGAQPPWAQIGYSRFVLKHLDKRSESPNPAPGIHPSLCGAAPRHIPPEVLLPAGKLQLENTRAQH